MSLGRFLAGEPVQARPINRPQKAWRWCKRRPVVASLAVALNLAIALGLAGILWQWRRAEAHASSETRARQKAEAESYTADMNLALQAWDERNLRRAQELLWKHVPAPGEPDLRDFEWRYLWKLCKDESRYAFTNFESDIDALAFSVDGRCFGFATGSAIKLVDLATGRGLGQVRNNDANDSINRLAICPKDHSIIAAVSQHGMLRLWNLATRESSVITQHLFSNAAMTFSPEGDLLATTSGRDLAVWNIRDKVQLWTRNTEVPAGAVVFSADGTTLVSGGGGGNGNVMVWDARTGKELQSFAEAHKGWMSQIAFSPDGKTLATSAADDKVILWDFATRRQKTPPIGNGGVAVAFSQDGRLLACIGHDQVARVWELEPLLLIAVLRGLQPVWCLTFTADSKHVVCGGANNTLRVWDATRLPDQDMLQHKHWVHQVAFSPDGQTVVSVDAHDFTKVWNVQSRQLVRELPGGGLYGGGAVFSPDGQVLVTSSYSGKVQIWDAATLESQGVLTNDFGVSSLSFSTDGQVLAVATGYTTGRPNAPSGLAFWSINPPKKLDRLADATRDAASVTFSRDGRYVAVGYHTGWVRLWNWETGRKLAEFRKHVGQVQTVAFSPDSSLLASGGNDDGYLVLYAVETAQVLRVVPAHTGGIKSVAFAPEGKTLASAGNDGTIRLWNLATYEPALSLKRHSGAVVGIAFSRDGNFLASAGADGDVRLWPAEPASNVPKSSRETNQSRAK